MRRAGVSFPGMVVTWGTITASCGGAVLGVAASYVEVSFSKLRIYSLLINLFVFTNSYLSATILYVQLHIHNYYSLIFTAS